MNNPVTTNSSSSINTYRSWLVCLTAGLFFFYEFIQLNMFNAIDLQLMKTFAIDASRVSRLASIYFIANLIFLFPAGLLLDRVSTRKLILISMSLCVLGTFLFALSHSLLWASIFRFMTGIGSAFCFLSCMRLASRWFSAHRLGLIIGVIVTMAMLGGLFAQTPLTLLAEKLGWRDAVMIDAIAGAFFTLLIAAAVQDYPDNQKDHFELLQHKLFNLGFWKSLKLSYMSRQNWLCGIYTSLMNIPIFILGALWGIPYLVQVHHFTITAASLITTALFIGTIIGAPIVGWCSDSICNRRRPMIIGAILSFIMVTLIIYANHLSFLNYVLLFFALGFTTSVQIISYPAVAESNSKAITATAVSVVSFCAISGGAIFQPLFGRLLDWNWTPYYIAGEPIYSAANYHLALLIIPIAFLIALMMASLIRETYGTPQDE